MGLPSDCNKEFEVNASGKTEQEAKDNALKSANDVCAKVLAGKGCSQAVEKGPGRIQTRNDDVVYFSIYICPKKPQL